MTNPVAAPVFTKAELFNIFVTALEGGIGYWSVATKYKIWQQPVVKGQEVEDLDGFFATINDIESGTTPGPEYRIDGAVIALGLERLLAGTVTFGTAPWDKGNQVMLWARMKAEDYDAGDADNVVQAGLFGDIVYG